jgi:hypothetical protein
MQDALFPDAPPDDEGQAPRLAKPRMHRAGLKVPAAPVDPEQVTLASTLPALLHLGTSS